MKKYVLLLIVPLLFFNSCEEEEQLQNETVGYNCSPLSGLCVESADGFYLNLEDCENECICDLNYDIDEDGVCDQFDLCPFDPENLCVGCSNATDQLAIECGELINIEIYTPVLPSIPPSDEPVHSGYAILTLRNCDSDNIGTYCINDWGLYDILDVGNYICPSSQYTSDWLITDSIFVFDFEDLANSGYQFEYGCSNLVDSTGNFITFN